MTDRQEKTEVSSIYLIINNNKLEETFLINLNLKKIELKLKVNWIYLLLYDY